MACRFLSRFTISIHEGFKSYRSRKFCTKGGAAGLAPIDSALAGRFEAYLSLFLRWNARVDLTTIRGEEGILRRHFIESTACARALPAGIATRLDFGSGAGFPGILIALCHPEIAVTLAESQGKKAAFQREAVRVLALPAMVHSGRAETLTESFDSMALRAVDRMKLAVQAAGRLVRPSGWLALMTTHGELEALKEAAWAEFAWADALPQPGGEDRVLTFEVREISSLA